ncbi:MAG: bifunctional UDP-N-acetylglucosamine diphosphorylase/glucosamine-1-phosphate N-acetyltransferase GlmU [Clostridia bacterium]|nr:bifunctional UDP-N-acetylglucosamine diphosphorylase/glucosamine-1-phosphate N-acetyltransferase GlmU [Clostridia bacterium]
MSLNCTVILAAGEGTRMKTLSSKVLTKVVFKSMLERTIDAALKSDVEDVCVVTGHKSEEVRKVLDDKYETVLQSELLGTGHAVMQARDFISRHADGNVLILNGDAPLMDVETVSGALKMHTESSNSATVISASIDNPFGYGRIVRDENGKFLRIVEQKHASEEEQKICEINSGAYWFKCGDLIAALDTLLSSPEKYAHGDKKVEYYLPEVLEILMEENKNVGAFTTDNPDVVLGANDRVQLLELNEIVRHKILNAQMLNGVSIPCTDGIIIGDDVVIGKDTEILPNTIIRGKTVIGENSVIGPNTVIDDSTIGNNTHLDNVKCNCATVCDNVTVGPFVNIRPNAVVSDSVHIGNFVEIKNSNIGNGSKVPHLSYIGDTDMGSKCNIGGGTITVNYDGKKKHRTTIGNDVFVGCNTKLVAPVKLGNHSYTAAGSTLTEDVPEDSLAIARSRQVIKVNWNKNK